MECQGDISMAGSPEDVLPLWSALKKWIAESTKG